MTKASEEKMLQKVYTGIMEDENNNFLWWFLWF
jgi:hypothetical protein